MQNTIKLKLQNFRRLAHTNEIIFRPGLTVISGPNGAGKTTLTESLIYALFGPSLKKGKGISDILTDNMVGTTLVECELIIDQQLVKIVRRGKTAELWINNSQIVQPIPSSAKIVNRQLQQMLGGLDRTQFECVYVALQGDTAGLVEEDARARYDIIERVLQLDVLRKALELQEEHRSEASGNVSGEGNAACHHLQFDESVRKLLFQFKAARKLQNRLEHAQKFLQRIEQTLKEFQINIEVIQLGLDEATTQVVLLAEKAKEQDQLFNVQKQKCQELDQLQSKYQGFATDISKTNGQLTAVQTDIQQYEEDIKVTEQYAEAALAYQQLSLSIIKKEQRLQRLPHIKSCYQILTRTRAKVSEQESQLAKFAKAEEELLQAQQKENKAKRQREALLQEDSLYTAELDTWFQQDAMLQQMRKQNKEALEMLQANSSEAKCPTCNQHFTEHTPEQRVQHLRRWLNDELPRQRTQLDLQKSQLDQRADQKKQDQKAAEKTHHDSQEALANCKSVITQRDLLREQCTNAQKDLEQAQNDWNDLGETADYSPSEETAVKDELESLYGQAKKLSEKATRYSQLPQLRQALKEKQTTQEKHREARKKLLQQQMELGYQPEQHIEARKQMQTAQESLSELQKKQITAQGIFDEAQANSKQAKSALSRAIDHHDRFETSVQEFYKEDRLYTLLDEFKKHFFEANTREVFTRTTHLLQHAITDQSILGIQFEGQNLSYLDASGAVRPVSRLSGGEKSLVGLCLRIALAEQAQAITRTGKVSFLILDEVLSSLDDERCSAVQRIFEDVQQCGIFEHILMITHLDSVKQGWRATGLEVRRKDTKTSEIIPIAPGAV